MTSSSPSPKSVLHVTNGDSVVATLRATELGGDTLSWLDVLCEGPVPALSQAELRATRASFLAQHGGGNRDEILSALERRDRLFAEALATRRLIVLWFEHDLFDQLQLLQVLAQADEVGVETARLGLINIGSFEGKPDFTGLGELDPPELESLWPLRRPVLAEQAKLARAGWAAVRDPDPSAIERFLDRDTSALPFLAPALRRFLQQLPDTVSGLSRSERQLLELLDDGPLAPWEVFFRSQELEEAPFEGDVWMWERLAALGTGEHALVASEHGGPPPPLPASPREAHAFAATQLTITETGRDVLAGRADLVKILGIDRWVGGTHLRPGYVPRWDRAQSAVTLAR
jgi:Domain of unknown function (DUF1835)